MAISKTDLDSFNQFARTKLQDSEITLDEVWHLWRIKHPTKQEQVENVAAINAAIKDYENGDRGSPAGEVIRELREKHELPYE